MSATEAETVRQEQADWEAGQETPDGTESGPDPEKGKLFEVPRVKVVVDDADPTVLKLAFAGGIEIERGDAEWVEFYNRLKAGQSKTFEITVHVAGAKQTHRRDSEGDVDAVVQTKSLIVTDIHLDG